VTREVALDSVLVPGEMLTSVREYLPFIGSGLDVLQPDVPPGSP
jgi:hypothetical protein